ncbi:FISUMP domain-containing protein [Prevotella sp. 10(H)]|uniref:FISUMP domain-containing protein n=1 Tax=Prevotella sp. 10(H) TaxID=1158294 RepID=UPI0012DD34DB|nr:FISUMP domain-containing protein [Prevotella sp. 10(H)]
MFETSPGSNTPTSDYTGPKKAPEDAKHTGLVVYNLNKCDGFGWGTYVWEGTEWHPLTDVKYLYQPDVSIANTEAIKINESTYLIHLPSGRDLRPFPSNKKFTLGVNWTDPTEGNLKKSAVETIDGGLKFVSGSHPDSWPGPIASSPISFDYYLNDMSDIIPSDNANVHNPFRSRETSITFETPENECKEKKNITVRLNQTNYRLTVKRDNTYFNTHSYRFRKKSEQFSTGPGVNYYRFLLLPPYNLSNVGGFREESNARRYATYKDETPGILSATVVPADIPQEAGEERIDGTSVLYNRNPTYISATSALNKRKKAGIITYTDTAVVNRFYPVEIHYMQCVVDGYDQTKIENASANPAEWGTKVLRHTDRNNNTFYSADFGSAGRWMITNLAATTYDEGSGFEGEALEVYQTIDLQAHDGGKRKYAYPMLDVTEGEPANWGTKPTGWRWEEGIFYNWYAATGRPLDLNNNNQEGASGTEPARVQGICPKGWYLPSDNEWNQLEQFVYNNISKYTTYDKEDIKLWTTNITTNAWLSSWNTTKGDRGFTIENEHLGHGAAMKDMCPPKSTATAFTYMQGSKGYSAEYNLGGFNATMVGRIKAKEKPVTVADERMIQYSRAYNVNYWTRSQNSAGDAWLRDFNVNYGSINRTTYIKTHLLSVRCKKAP